MDNFLSLFSKDFTSQWQVKKTRTERSKPGIQGILHLCGKFEISHLKISCLILVIVIIEQKQRLTNGIHKIIRRNYQAKSITQNYDAKILIEILH